MSRAIQVGMFLNGFYNSNAPLAGGKVYVYDAGGVVAQPNWSSAIKGAPTLNAQPVILDSEGRAGIFCDSLQTGTLVRTKFIVKDASDNTIATFDNLTYANVVYDILFKTDII